ncbi:unnamed protein product [Polarella glacialis]|uniref:Uncharacterized protein n=1 Tax=Polarella glacialis TaxID=89957 RepID=A0A813GBZ1_POLGL|nr:unnamed protein product [Polarella glacialis]CAE8625167.1 unnamed protein product [Polarella glacialis]
MAWSIAAVGRSSEARVVATSLAVALAGASLLWYLLREGEEEEEIAQAPLPRGLSHFRPTSEWQEVPPGCACPPGLEYRMDLSTERSFARWPPPG